jgi:hypothetical protein
MKLMELPVSARSVEAAWKTNMPWPLRVSEPLTSSEDVELYTPATSVSPVPMVMPTVVDGLSPAAML